MGLPNKGMQWPRVRLIGGSIGIAVVGILATAYLLSQPQPHPRVKGSMLVALPPVFEPQTSSAAVSVPVTLTLSNAGSTDLECDLKFFDCRSADNPAISKAYTQPSGTIILRSGTSTNLVLVDLDPGGIDESPARVCCYGIHWREPDPGSHARRRGTRELLPPYNGAMTSYGPPARYPGTVGGKKAWFTLQILEWGIISGRSMALTTEHGVVRKTVTLRCCTTTLGVLSCSV
jgi:hypothetical protein